MHPSLRILAVMIFIPLVAHGGWLVAMVGASGVALLLSGTGRTGWARFLGMNRRLRWFYVSIVLLFGWFTPGRELLPITGFLSPTTEGLLAGAGRVTVLAMVVGAVVWLLERSSRHDLIAGLLWLTRPLAWLGFPRERFAVRLTLVLETVPQVQPMVSEARQVEQAQGAQDWANRARGLFERIVDKAESASCESIEVDPGRPPGLRDWCALALLFSPLLGLMIWQLSAG
jgi:energy-coupling factor transport system permease protein